MKANRVSEQNSNPRPSRLSLIREQGLAAIPRIPKRGQYSIPIEKIIEDPRNERKTYRGIEDLVETILRVGIIEPPTVIPIEDDRYMITTGHRRFRAAKVAGLKEIPVLIGYPEEETIRRRKSLISNVQRQDVDPVEMAEGLLALKEEDPTIHTNRDLAAVIGKSEQWVGEMLKILNLSGETKRRILESPHRVSFDAAVQLARLEAPEAQAELLVEIESGAPVRAIRKRASELKGRPRRPDPMPRESRTRVIEMELATVTVTFRDGPPTREGTLLALREALLLLETAS